MGGGWVEKKWREITREKGKARKAIIKIHVYRIREGRHLFISIYIFFVDAFLIHQLHHHRIFASRHDVNKMKGRFESES